VGVVHARRDAHYIRRERLIICSALIFGFVD